VDFTLEELTKQLNPDKLDHTRKLATRKPGWAEAEALRLFPCSAEEFKENFLKVSLPDTQPQRGGYDMCLVGDNNKIRLEHANDHLSHGFVLPTDIHSGVEYSPSAKASSDNHVGPQAFSLIRIAQLLPPEVTKRAAVAYHVMFAVSTQTLTQLEFALRLPHQT
jgi:hypothetical protein